MKRSASFLLISLTVIITFCGCAAQALENTLSDQNAVTVTMPEDNSVNGYRPPTTEDAPQQRPSGEEQTEKQDSSGIKSIPSVAAEEPYRGLYYANIRTKKFHRADCGYAARISGENLYITDNRQELIDQGYEPCCQCTP